MGNQSIVNKIIAWAANFGYKKLIIITSVLVVIVLVASFFYRRSQPGYTERYTDKDTGETLSKQPNTTPETTGGIPSVTILGSASLYKFGASGLSIDQVSLFNEDLADSGIKKIANHDEIVKIINPSYNRENYTITADLLYKEGEPAAKLIFAADSIYTFNYKILINNSTVYQSDSLIVGSPNYTGDGAPPEEQ